MNSSSGIHILILVAGVALGSACSRRQPTNAPIPISLQRAETVLYCEIVPLSASKSVYIVRDVWKQASSTSAQYAPGDAITLGEPFGPPGSYVVIHLGGGEGDWSGGFISVIGGEVLMEVRMPVRELRRAIRENVELQGDEHSTREVLRDLNSSDTPTEDASTAEISEMQRQILSNARPVTRAEILTELRNSHAGQQAHVNAAMMALERAQTESEIRRAHTDLRLQQSVLEALENRLREELAKQASERNDDSVPQLQR